MRSATSCFFFPRCCSKTGTDLTPARRLSCKRSISNSKYVRSRTRIRPLLVQLVPCRCDRFRALGRTSVSSVVSLAQDSGRTAQDSAHGYCTERTGPRGTTCTWTGGGEDALCDSGPEYDLATHTRDHSTRANYSRDAAPAGSLISLWIGLYLEPALAEPPRARTAMRMAWCPLFMPQIDQPRDFGPSGESAIPAPLMKVNGVPSVSGVYVLVLFRWFI